MLSILRESTFVHGIEESYNFQVSHFCHIWKSIHVVFIYVIYRFGYLGRPVFLPDIRRTYYSMSIHAPKYIEASSFLGRDLDKARSK